MRKVLLFLFIIYYLLSSASSVHALTPNDFLIGEQWYLQTIGAYKAWEETTGSSQVIVAVLDSGVDLNHEDLTDNLWNNQSETAGDHIDNDHNGYEDDVLGWDFVNNDPDPSPDISATSNVSAVSHGTVVAGMIGAVGNNGKGVVGVNWHVKIMPLKILDDQGIGTTARASAAIRYAVQNGAQIINVSFTTTVKDTQLEETIAWAVEQGVLVVAAVGNTENGGTSLNTQPEYPACFDLDYGQNVVLGVAATDSKDKKASFSNFGSRCTDLSAPGVDIFGTVFQDFFDERFSSLYGGPWQGTSLAAPMVAGAAALLKSVYPTLTPEQTRIALQLSVDPLKDTADINKQMGAGRINIARALELLPSVVVHRAAATAILQPVHNSQTFVAAEEAGASPLIKRLDAHGTLINSFYAYDPAFRGGVRLAMADVTGDGVEEIVTGTGPGGGPQIRIFDLNGNVRGQFFAFSPLDRHGIFVALGDVDGDGKDEIIVTQDTGGTGQVKIFDDHGKLFGSFYPLKRTSTALHVATGNMDDDPEDELLFTLGSVTDPRVWVYNGIGTYVRDFPVLVGSDSQGVFVAAGDVTGDGKDDVVVSNAAGASPLVAVYTAQGQLNTTFFAYHPALASGVSVSVGDIDKNGVAEIYTGTDVGGGPQVRMFNVSGTVIGGFFSFASTDRFGVVSAIW